MTHKPYPRYKETGVKWIGKVPEHWEVKRLKHIADVRLSNVDKHTVEGQKIVRLCNYLDVYNNTHITSKIEFMSATASDSQIKRLSLQKNDVVITKDSEDPSDIGIPALVEEDIFGLVCGYHLAILRPIVAEGEFLHYLLQSIFVRSAFEVEATGMTRYALGKYSIENLIFALPHQSEQKSIVSFLDQETSRIDNLISEKERLISLLQEYRQALISHAVTKGLDPTVKMKDSGVEWLGEVPEHWEVMKLQRCVSISEGQVNPEEGQYSSMILIAPNHIESGSGRLLDLETASEQSAESGKYFCKSGDIIYSKIRPALRKVCIAPQDCLCSADMYPLHSQNGLKNNFLYWFILSEPFSALAVLESERVAMPKINRESLKEVMIALPPEKEQNLIISFLDHQTSRINTLLSEARKFIELLKGYRSSLITAAVTGKIDVREVVPSGSEKREIAHG